MAASAPVDDLAPRRVARIEASFHWRETIRRVARTLYETRTLLGWSQDQLARRAVVSQGAVSRVESGHCTNIPFRTIVALTHQLGQAAREAGLPLSPVAQALSTLAGPVPLATPDPDFTHLAHAYHRCTPLQRRAVLQLLQVLTEDAPDPIPPSCAPGSLPGLRKEPGDARQE